MENPLFRKKSMERVSSPEQLNEYIKVTSPGVWAVLAAVLVLIIGFIVWGVVGKLETKVSAVAVSEEGQAVCYVRQEDVNGIAAGNAVRFGDKEYPVSAVSAQPVKVDEGFSEYTKHVGGFSDGEWVYKVTLDAELTEGVYKASIVTGSVSPISFLFG